MTQVKEKKKKSPFIKPRDSKMLQQKEKKEVKVKARKKEKVTLLIQFILQLAYWIRKWNSSQKVQNNS